MRADFVLVRGPGDQERFADLAQLAARIHALRGERMLFLQCFDLGHTDGEAGPCVAIRAGDGGEARLGWALFPETVAYQGDDKRTRLAKALLDLKPCVHRSFDGERAVFDKDAA